MKMTVNTGKDGPKPNQWVPEAMCDDLEELAKLFPVQPVDSEVFEYLHSVMSHRLLILDGAMGTMIQRHKLEESDYRGERFADWPSDLKGNNDLLPITKPDIIREIHLAYLRGGADMVETDTFNAQCISLADYGMGNDEAVEINLAACKVAREACDIAEQEDGNRRLVAGSIGPMNRTLSISPSVEDPGARGMTFDEAYEAYKVQVDALYEGGADVLLVETIFDTLNAKAALLAINDVAEQRGERKPLFISGTIVDKSGRTLSGQTIEAFWTSVMHSRPFCIGLNCALGAEDMRPYAERLSTLANCYVHAYPNAGLPNLMGEYDQLPTAFAEEVRTFVDARCVNMLGGCCGTSPEHIGAMADKAKKLLASGVALRELPTAVDPYLRTSGLEMLHHTPTLNFVNIGERCNIAGSRRFKKMVCDGRFQDAVAVAAKQIDAGAQMLDVNVDDGLVDGKSAMTRFLNLLMSEPDVARVPVVVDSSRFDVVIAGLKCLQGRSVVNSISLKVGVEEFIRQARRLRAFGCAVVVMAFDEEGQAASAYDKVRICQRAFRILTSPLVGMPACDIIFDPNVLTIATVCCFCLCSRMHLLR
ncbi:MAG: hypothetical protein MHM6MM_005476 [Cercozoa sp. M6MM]